MKSATKKRVSKTKVHSSNRNSTLAVEDNATSSLQSLHNDGGILIGTKIDIKPKRRDTRPNSQSFDKVVIVVSTNKDLATQLPDNRVGAEMIILDSQQRTIDKQE